MEELYSDGIADIYVARGLAFLDFYHLMPDENGHHKRETFLRVTIPMTMQGLFGLINTGDTVVKRLVASGVFVSKPIESAPVPEKKASAAKKTDKKPAAKPAAKPAPAPAKKAEAKPAAKPAPAPAKKAEAKPAAKPKKSSK